MDNILVKMSSAKTENGKILYGGEVYLNNELVKIIPLLSETKSEIEKLKKYLNHLRKNLYVRNTSGFKYLIYRDSKGNEMEYWNNVPIPFAY